MQEEQNGPDPAIEAEIGSAVGDTAMAYASADYPVLALFWTTADGGCDCQAAGCAHPGKC